MRPSRSAVEGVGQAQNSRQLQDALPSDLGSALQAFFVRSWQRAAMIAGDDAHPAHLLCTPAQGRRQPLDQVVGGFVMPFFFLGAANVMQQSALPARWRVDPAGIRRQLPDRQSVIKLKRQTSDMKRVLEVRIEERSPEFQAAQRGRFDLLSRLAIGCARPATVKPCPASCHGISRSC